MSNFNMVFIKSKYRWMNGTHYKHFLSIDEMETFFNENKMCKFISYEIIEKNVINHNGLLIGSKYHEMIYDTNKK